MAGERDHLADRRDACRLAAPLSRSGRGFAAHGSGAPGRRAVSGEAVEGDGGARSVRARRSGSAGDESLGVGQAGCRSLQRGRTEDRNLGVRRRRGSGRERKGVLRLQVSIAARVAVRRSGRELVAAVSAGIDGTPSGIPAGTGSCSRPLTRTSGPTKSVWASTAVTPRPLELNGPAVVDDRDVKLWSFEGAAAQVVRVTAYPSTAFMAFDVVSPAGEAVAMNDGQMVVRLPLDGRYVVRVRFHHGDYTGGYGVAVSRVPATAEARSTLRMNTPARGELNQEGIRRRRLGLRGNRGSAHQCRRRKRP